MERMIRILPKSQAVLILFLCLSYGARNQDTMAQPMKDPSPPFPASASQFNRPDRPDRFRRNPGASGMPATSQALNKIRTIAQSKSTVTESISQNWFIDHWVNVTRQLSTQNDQGLNTVNVLQSWSIDRWTNDQRSLYRYDGQGIMIESKAEKWRGGGWVADYIENYIHTPENRLEFSSHYSFSENGTAVISGWKYYCIYDARGRQTAIVDSCLDEGRQQWRLRSTATTQYDSLDRLIENLQKYSREDADMPSGYVEFSMKTIYTYDDINRTYRSVAYAWDPYLSSWAPNTRTSGNQDENGSGWTQHEIWFNNSWVPSHRYQQLEDAATRSNVYTSEWYENGVLTGRDKVTSFEIDTTYSGKPGKAWVNITERMADGQWLLTNKNISWYNPENLSSGYLSQRWADGSWWNVSRTMNTNQLVDPETLPESCTLANYPNPFNSSTTILFKMTNTLDVRLMVVDIRGRLVLELESGTFGDGVYQTVWTGMDASGRPVPSGVYAVILKADKIMASRKVMVIR
jgi:hypothetical protein